MDTSPRSRRLDDDDYPAYPMGAAAELLGVTPAFLRSLDESGFLAPHRSRGGHRRYSRRQLTLAERVRELLDQGMPLAAACRVVGLEDRVVGLEDRLDRANRRINELEAEAGDARR